MTGIRSTRKSWLNLPPSTTRCSRASRGFLTSDSPSLMRLWLLGSVLLSLTACQWSKPPEERSLRLLRLVDLAQHDPELVIDLQYKHSHNLAGRPLYHPDFPALLHEGTAKRLKKAHRILRKQGLRLVIWDAYRPQETQWALWHASGHNETFVANPRKNPSLHSHACAVDVTLLHLDGSPAAVATGFDDFSAAAASDFPHPDPQVLAHREKLQRAMWAAGFGTLPHEWWHFMDQDYREIPVIDTSRLPARLQSMISSMSR